MVSTEQRAARAKWVAALRSGDYNQTTGVLHRLVKSSNGKPPGFCCLGVACDITPGVARGIEDDQVRYNGSSVDLPESVMDFLGLDEGGPVVKLPNGSPASLIDLNDDKRYTFDQIADVIEAQDDDWNGTEYTV